MLCNDPTDPHRPLGFQTNTLNTPLFMEGTIATISTRCPSLEELESCQNIYLSEAESWDPPNVKFKIILMEEDLRHSISSRLIFDITISSISSELCEVMLTARLVSAVNVHDIKPAHNPTIPDTPLSTAKIAIISKPPNL